MPRDKKKRRDSSDSDSGSGSSSEEKKPPAKKQKSSAAKGKSEDNEPQWQLSADKIIKIREFKGKLYIDIRQYYNGPNGDALPTKKGVIQTVRNFILDDDQLDQYMEIFDKEITRGVDKETYEEAMVKSVITHVNKLPSGNEEGQFLGLDFSGPTIKVMLVKLKNRECTVTRKLYDIPERYMVGKSEKLFDFLAKSIAGFVQGLKLNMLRIPLGVTFGFPIEQTSLQECTLTRWTKGFQCNDLVGKNVLLKLKNSIRKFPELKNVYVIGIVNDSVSAVLACAWQDPSCVIGAVIGLGSSLCYAEKAHKVTKYEAENFGIRDIYINLDSADLGEDGTLAYIFNEFDQQMDEESKTQGKLINDKLISMAYFGELSRLALLKCIEIGAILDGVTSDFLKNKNAIEIDHLTRIESDPDTDHQNCKEVLAEFGYSEATDEDCFQVQFVCRCVYRRSANLVAAQLATLINRVQLPSVTIAIDGFLIKKYPNYKWYMTKKLQNLIRDECTFQLTESEESGLGPAVMAAVFGKDVMDRDEKFRRLPGFPMDKCHFGKKGRCLNPDCAPGHPCDTSNVNPNMKPMITKEEDLCSPSPRKEDKKDKRKSKEVDKNTTKKCHEPCTGYDRL